MKDKAKELFDKFYSIVKYSERAIECAILCVDELIENVEFTYEKAYWQEVKKELEAIK